MTPFVYQAPGSIEDALAAVEPMGPAGQGGAFLAGGTTILDLMKLSVVAPPSLTDIRHLGMNAIEQDADELYLGSRVTMAEAAAHPFLRERAPVLSEALWKAASPQLRNVATLGGNVLQRTRCPYFRDNVSPCNKREPGSGCAAIGGINRLLAVLGTSEHCIANYAGDFANALLLFDTVVETALPDGGRDVPLGQLHRLPGDQPQRETVLEDDELIVGFRLKIPAWARRSRFAGSKDRAAVRDHVFDVLRQRRSAAHFGGGETGRALMIGLLRMQDTDPAALFNGEGHAPSVLTDDELERPDMPTDKGVAWDLPDWLVPLFETSLDDRAESVAHALQSRAPITLRVNTSKTDVAAAVAQRLVLHRVGSQRRLHCV